MEKRIESRRAGRNREKLRESGKSPHATVYDPQVSFLPRHAGKYVVVGRPLAAEFDRGFIYRFCPLS